MNRVFRAFLVGTLALFAAQAKALSVPFEFNGVNYDVTTVTGTFNDLGDTLDDQIWWGNSSIAGAFATAIGTQLGSPSENTGLTFSSWGPLFAVAVSGSTVNSIARDVGGVFNFTVQGPNSNIGGTHTYAVASAAASPVPLPATALLILSGLFAMGAFRLRRRGPQLA